MVTICRVGDRAGNADGGGDGDDRLLRVATSSASGDVFTQTTATQQDTDRADTATATASSSQHGGKTLTKQRLIEFFSKPTPTEHASSSADVNETP